MQNLLKWNAGLVFVVDTRYVENNRFVSCTENMSLKSST
jgi:hypothetical protein